MSSSKSMQCMLYYTHYNYSLLISQAYDEALKGLDKLKTLITSTANLENVQLLYKLPLRR